MDVQVVAAIIAAVVGVTAPRVPARGEKAKPTSQPRGSVRSFQPYRPSAIPTLPLRTRGQIIQTALAPIPTGRPDSSHGSPASSNPSCTPGSCRPTLGLRHSPADRLADQSKAAAVQFPGAALQAEAAVRRRLAESS